MFRNLLTILKYFIVFFKEYFLKSKINEKKILPPKKKEIFYYEGDNVGLPIEHASTF